MRHNLLACRMAEAAAPNPRRRTTAVDCSPLRHAMSSPILASVSLNRTVRSVPWTVDDRASTNEDCFAGSHHHPACFLVGFDAGHCKVRSESQYAVQAQSLVLQPGGKTSDRRRSGSSATSLTP